MPQIMPMNWVFIYLFILSELFMMITIICTGVFFLSLYEKKRPQIFSKKLILKNSM